MNENTITYEDICSNPNIRTYIQKADEMLSALGFTEHSFAHVTLCAQKAGDLLAALGLSLIHISLIFSMEKMRALRLGQGRKIDGVCHRQR